MYKITYLSHSGFLVELKGRVLIFDVYKVPVPRLDPEKKIEVFVSHKHQDHFDLRIFDLERQYPQVHYYLGSDVKLSAGYLERNGISPDVREKITNIGKHKSLELEDMTVHTLRSTDAGVAFVVETEGKRFYHAGDLNWWHWSGETEEYNRAMAKAYRDEIDRLEGVYFDAAFVPLDPRLEEAYHYGLDYFLEKTECGRVFPMHMWGEYGWIEKYRQTETGKKYRAVIMDISQELETWSI